MEPILSVRECHSGGGRIQVQNAVGEYRDMPRGETLMRSVYVFYLLSAAVVLESADFSQRRNDNCYNVRMSVITETRHHTVNSYI